MSNEELVALIQAGGAGQVGGAVGAGTAIRLEARSPVALDGRGGVTAEDLAQSGFLARYR